MEMVSAVHVTLEREYSGLETWWIVGVNYLNLELFTDVFLFLIQSILPLGRGLHSPRCMTLAFIIQRRMSHHHHHYHHLK